MGSHGIVSWVLKSSYPVEESESSFGRKSPSAARACTCDVNKILVQIIYSPNGMTKLTSITLCVLSVSSLCIDSGENHLGRNAGSPRA